MHSSSTKGGGAANRLLAGLPVAELDTLLAHAERVTLAFNQPLYGSSVTVPYVYFPLTAVIALLVVMGDGQKTEVGTIGNEGMAGLPVFLGGARATEQAICLIPGEAYRLAAEDVQVALAQHGGVLFGRLLRYTQALLVQTAQGAACNRLHPSEARLCRWLVMTHDRVMGDTFSLTQEAIARMLGIRRAGVSDIASRLQRAGLIHYRRGTMTIMDRVGLEACACECYPVIRGAYDWLLPPPLG